MKKLIALVLTVVAFSAASFAQTLKEALRLTDNEQYEAARDAYKALIAKEQNNGINYYYLGENYLLSEEPDSALQKAGPKNAQAYIEAADAFIHFKNTDLDKAKSYLEKAWNIDSKNVEIQLLYGDVYSLLNNGTLAADYYNKAMEMEKNNARPI